MPRMSFHHSFDTEVKMKALIFPVLFAISFSAAACPLNGKWKSDKAKTLAELNGTNISADRKAKLSKLFGRMVVDYKDCKTAVVDFGGKKSEFNFKVVEESPSALVIKDAESGEMTRMTLEGNCYSVPVKGMGFNEHFCKL
jgi:hypothetical protein